MASPRERREAQCPRCLGWAVEPDHHPMTVCKTCGGTGKRGKLVIAS